MRICITSLFTMIVLSLINSGTLFSQSTLVLQPGPADGKDAMVIDKYPTTPYPDYPNVEAEAWTSSGAFVSRNLLGFDLSALSPGTVITDAKLSLYYAPQIDGDQQSSLSGPNTCLLQRVTAPWDEATVTWDTQPTVTTINEVTLPASTTSTQDYLDIDVLAMVLDEFNGGSTDFSLLLRLETEQYYRRLNFASSDYSDVTKWPKLVITYQCDVNATIAQTSNMLTASPAGGTYQWYDCSKSQPVSGEINQYYLPAGSGSYAVIVSKDGCIDTSDCFQYSNAGMNEISRVSDFTVYPNPGNGVFNIDLNGVVSGGGINIKVYNSIGQIVFDNKLEISSLDKKEKIDLSHCEPGVYIVKIITTDIIGTQRIILK